jgi:hypothetical protein
VAGLHPPFDAWLSAQAHFSAAKNRGRCAGCAPGDASMIPVAYSLLVTADTGLLAPPPASVELSVLVTVLTPPVTEDSGVLEVELATAEPTVLTADVTGASAPLDELVGLLALVSVLVSEETGFAPLVRAEVGLEPELPVSVELSVLVTVLTLPVTEDSGVLEVELATVAPTVLTADVTGASAPVELPPLEPAIVLVMVDTGFDDEPVLVTELNALVGFDVELPVSAELSVLVTVLTLPVTDDSGVLDVDALRAEPTVLTAEVTGESAPVGELVEPPPIAELSVLVSVLTLPVTEDSGVLDVDALRVEPTVLTAEVTGARPLPAVALLSEALSVLVTVLTVPPTVDNGVFAVELEVVLPIELTLDVTGASGLVEPLDELFVVEPPEELLDEPPPELLLAAEELPLSVGELRVPPPQPPRASSASTPIAIADLLKMSIESSLIVSGARNSGRALS